MTKQPIDWIKFCKAAGKEVSREITSVYNNLERRNLEYGRGDGGDITLEGDRIAEEILIRRLTDTGLNIHLISEEIGEMKIGKFRSLADTDFIVVTDPLDGSYNFKNGIPYYAHSIAVLNPSFDVIAGYVKDIPKNDEYYATKEKGAFRNGSKIKTSNRKSDFNILLECSPKSSRADIEFLSRSFLQTRRARAFGAVALDLCWIANGTFDALLYGGSSRYLDVAAGLFIVEQAGGTVGDFNGNSIVRKGTKLISKNLLVSGNKKTEEAILKNRWVIPKKK